MREDIQRIVKLAVEGKIAVEDAADLIEAMVAQNAHSGPAEPAEGTYEGHTQASSVGDSVKQVIDHIEKMAREGFNKESVEDATRRIGEAAERIKTKIKVKWPDIDKVSDVFARFGPTANKVQTLPLPDLAGKQLKIENPSGDIHILASNTPGTITASATIRGADSTDARAKADAYTIMVEETSGQVCLKQPAVAGLSVDLEITVPSVAAIDIRNESGNVLVEKLKAALTVDVKHGNFSAQNTSGAIHATCRKGDVSISDAETTSLTVESTYGNVRLWRVIGSVNVRASAGNVDLVDSSGGSVALESVEGNIRAQFSQPVNGTVSIRTVRGDAVAYLAGGSDCRVNLASIQGDVRCSIPLDEIVKADRRITGQLGTGTGNVDVSTVNGNVILELTDSASTANEPFS